MKKLATLLVLAFIFTASNAQEEVGYNTTDVGAEFQYYKDGKFIGLHLAHNAKLHHSFYGAIGYYMAGDPTASFYTNKTNGGLGVGLGYRYYFNLRPHGMFIGANANAFTYKVMLDAPSSSEPVNSTIFIPSLQTGYMFLINDMFFITPTVAAGYKMNLQTEMKVEEAKLSALLGISCGFKF